LFNSGKGIDNHKNTDDLYVPYKGIKLCDNINDKDKYIQAIQKIYCVLLINHLVYTTTHTTNYKSSIEELLEEINKYSNYKDNIFKINKTSVTYSIEDTFGGKDSRLWKELLVLESSLNEQYLHSLIVKNELSLIDDYYNLICKIINAWGNEFNVSFVVQNININVNILHQINSNITLSDSLIKKLKFHNIDDTNNIYIYPQQSGSCTWFSLYWPILFYFVINDDVDEYKNMIEHIILFFYKELHNKIFIQSVFDEIINHQDYYTYMFKLYSKFVDLELFDNNLLTSNIDNYYNKPIKIEIQRYKYQNNITNDIYYIDFNKLNYDHTSTVTNNTDMYDHIFTKIFSHSSITKVDLYLFLSMQYHKNNLFSSDRTVSITNITNSVNSSGITVNIKHIINFIEKFKNINDTDMYYLAPYAYYTYDYYNIPIDTSDFKSFLLFMKQLILITNFYIVIHNDFIVVKDMDGWEQIYKDYMNKILNIIVKYILIDTGHVIDIIEINQTQLNNRLNTDIFQEFNYPDNINKNENLLIDYFPNLERTIDDYHIKKIFYYEHPEYLLLNYNEYEILKDFIKLHIFDLFKEDNNRYRINLLKFYINVWWTKLSDLYDNINEKELFTKKISDNNDKTLVLHVMEAIYLLLYKNKTQDYFILHKNLNDLKKQLNFSNLIELYEYMVQISTNNIDITTSHIFINRIKKLLVIDTERSTQDKLIIDGIEYIQHNLMNASCLLNFFDSENNIYYVDNFILLADLDLELKNKIIYKFYYNKYIKFVCDITKTGASKCQQNKFDIKILEIYYNNDKVIKYGDIKHPFKYLIPLPCFHFIYLKNDIYNISFFINMRNTEDKTWILKKSTLEPDTYTFSINPSTKFLFDKIDSSEYKNLINIFSDFQINKYNIVYFINREIVNKKNGYCTNDKFILLMDNYKIKLDDIVENIKSTKIDVLKKKN
jgi:hypothetical protein